MMDVMRFAFDRTISEQRSSKTEKISGKLQLIEGSNDITLVNVLGYQ